MRTRLGTTIGIAAALSMLVLATGASAAGGEHKYVGVKTCGICHKADLIGDQLAAWKKSPHAKAYETLKSDAAAKIAKEKGLSVPAYEADECLKCHSTAHGLEKSQIYRRPLADSDGVQCESCHGPGSDYRSKKTMADPAKAAAAGLQDPGKNEKICTGCHNAESPNFKGFDYAKFKAMIAHPIPADVKGHYLEAERELRKKRRESMGK